MSPGAIKLEMVQQSAATKPDSSQVHKFPYDLIISLMQTNDETLAVASVAK